MNRSGLIALARDLSNANGASGFEDEVVSVLRRVAADFSDLVTYRPGVLNLPASAWDAAEARVG